MQEQHSFWFDTSPKMAMSLECIVFLLKKEVLKELLAKFHPIEIYSFELNPITNLQVIYSNE